MKVRGSRHDTGEVLQLMLGLGAFTFGGVKVGTSAQMIATGGRPIPGLYALGTSSGCSFTTIRR